MTFPLVPCPKEIQILDGQFILMPGMKILRPESLSNEASILAERLREVTGYPFETSDEDPTLGEPAIALLLHSDLLELGSEGYKLEVGANVIVIKAFKPAGIFYGIQTLFQLLPPAIYGRGPRVNVAWILPHVRITDKPEFSWRGSMLDCSRHFMPLKFLKKFLDGLALHKMNRFHWHLTDDQGWRIEIKKYPFLTTVGSRRAETPRGHYDAHAGGDNSPHEGFYSQEDIRELVAYAAERHILIVPEIEVPGHCQAALAAYPEYGPPQVTHPVSTRWGVDPQAIFYPTEATFAFLSDIFREVAELFPGPYIHVGGDEAVRKCWENDSQVKLLMTDLNIHSGVELQGYFMKRVRGIIENLGRFAIGWDEILESPLEPGATVTIWRGMERVASALQLGHNVVICSMAETYFDFYQSENSQNEPLAGGPVLTLEKTYEFNPIPGDLAPGASKQILGLQAQLWTEYMPTPDIVEYMAFPRMAAIAETGWRGGSGKNYAEFLGRLRIHLQRLNVHGINYRPL